MGDAITAHTAEERQEPAIHRPDTGGRCCIQPSLGEGMASRGKLRTFLGAEQMRQLILK